MKFERLIIRRVCEYQGGAFVSPLLLAAPPSQCFFAPTTPFSPLLNLSPFFSYSFLPCSLDQGLVHSQKLCCPPDVKTNYLQLLNKVHEALICKSDDHELLDLADDVVHHQSYSSKLLLQLNYHFLIVRCIQIL